MYTLFSNIKLNMNSYSSKGSTNYGLSGNYNTHMIKNTEWGAFAILSQSKYGKYGNANYTDANKEVYINNNSNYITGCSGGSPSASSSDSCDYSYNVSGNGTGASTTGTIYGVYDTSGGAWESVMGNLNGRARNAGSNAIITDKIYYNYYSVNGIGEIKGDTTNYRFYGDKYANVNTNKPWFMRGGSFTDTPSSIGIFAYNSCDGAAAEAMSTRFVISTW